MANAPSEQRAKHLKRLREAAGLSLRDLAKQIGETHSSISYWETTGKLPRSEVLIPLAKALGVSVEELLGSEAATKKRTASAPAGRLRSLFEEASKLPRRQQQKLAEFVQLFISQNSTHKDNPA